MKENSILISFLYPHLNPKTVKKLLDKKITSFAMELIPRISRAQDMDVLSSQATVSGYKAVLIAANSSRFFFPMLTTAAGSIRPAKVFIIGVGVAGLQAIATARRLGAQVSAYDVRPETKEQTESLGAKFVDTGIQAAGEGGYARELTLEEKNQQVLALKKHISTCDIIITTAGVPGKPAPKVLTKEMVETMKPGSVIVDLLAEMGGNCELTKPGEIVHHNDITILGPVNIPSSLSIHASEMYARNIINLLSLMVKDKELNLDWNDEIISGSCVTHMGEIKNENLQKLLKEKL
jgi:NAD(P) transhydrogenase subunit alpha